MNKLTKGVDGKFYKVVNGTWYNKETDDRVIYLLNSNINQPRQDVTRFKFHYGDPKTGKAWGDVETGYVGRSTGSIKIPLLIAKANSIGGGRLLDHCIIKIEYANKRRGTYPLYELK